MGFGMGFGIGMGLWQMGWDDGIWDGIWDGMGVGILPFPLIWVASIHCAIQISRHPVVVYHHSTRLDELVRMVVFPFLYDHWMPS